MGTFGITSPCATATACAPKRFLPNKILLAVVYLLGKYTARASGVVAMVHYCFANNEALIGAVVEYLVQQFLQYQTAPTSDSEDTPLHRLRRWFANAWTYQQEHPKLAL